MDLRVTAVRSLVSLAIALAVAAPASSQVDVAELRPAVVKIRAGNETGAGLVVNMDGDTWTVVTAFHVIEPHLDEGAPLEIDFWDRGVRVAAKEDFEYNSPLDVAVFDVRLESGADTPLPKLRLADLSAAPVGSRLHTIGHPGNLDWEVGLESLRRTNDPEDPRRFLFTQQGIAGGSSGGPVLDADGALAGLVVQKSSTHARAVHIAAIRQFLDAWNVATSQLAGRGPGLLDRTVEAHGGADRIRDVRSFRRETYTPGTESASESRIRVEAELPDRRRERQISREIFTMSVGPPGTFAISSQGLAERDEQLDALISGILLGSNRRELVAVLRAYLEDEVRVAMVGLGNVDGVPADRVNVNTGLDDLTLYLRRGDGRVLKMTYVHPNVGETEETYSDFRYVGGVLLPHRTKTVHVGQKPPYNAPKQSSVTRLEINPQLPDHLFARPVAVEGTVTPPVVISKPDYGPSAPAEGPRSVAAELFVDGAGEVIGVTITDRLESTLHRNVLLTFSRWRFEPATRGGRPLAVYFNTTMSLRGR